LTIAEELGAMHQERPFSRLSLADMMRALRTVQGRKGSIPADTKDLSELILPEELREQLQTIAARMRDIERVEKLGGTVPTGLLFYGEPGTGKTECGRALAKATDWAFLQTTGNDLINDNAQLDKLYAEAKDIRPCIFFIDEADDILASREYSPYKSLTNKLLTIMDGGSGKVRDIVFIAATNHPDSIDKAALRGGRFTEKLFFEYPDASGVAKFVRTWMKKSPATFAAELSPDTIAGMIGADSSIATVSAILQEAVNRMIGRSTDSDCQVSEKDLRAAITTVKGRY
jgi:transitional endoplasmic reticulum ATPase